MVDHGSSCTFLSLGLGSYYNFVPLFILFTVNFINLNVFLSWTVYSFVSEFTFYQPFPCASALKHQHFTEQRPM